MHYDILKNILFDAFKVSIKRLNFIVSIFWKLKETFDREILYNEGTTVHNLKKGPGGQATTKETL